jgi:hypothetical protein
VRRAGEAEVSGHCLERAKRIERQFRTLGHR